MMRRHAIAAVFILAGVLVAPAALGQQRAADGVTINDEGQTIGNIQETLGTSRG